MRAQELLEAGLERHRAGDRASAETCFRRAVAAEPAEPAALYLLGLLRFEAGDGVEAARLFEQVTALRPTHLQSWLSLATLRQLGGDPAGAAQAYRRVVALEPGHAAALTGLAQTLVATGDLEGALEAAERGVAAAPALIPARLALGAALVGLGRSREAAGVFEAATAIAPDLAAAHLGRALQLLKLGEAEPALTSAQRAITLEPEAPLAWRTLGAVLRRLGRSAAAADAFERAIVLDPGDADAHETLGLIEVDLERLARAERHLERAVALNPRSGAAHAALASLHGWLGRWEPARTHALAALEIDPLLIAAHETLARIYAREGRAEDARRHRDLAYGTRSLYEVTAAAAEQRVLVLVTTDIGNTPDRFLLPAERYTRLFWFVEYAQPGDAEALPPYDVVFNAIGDEDEAGPTAAKVDRFLQHCRRPVLNPPAKVARTARHLAPAVLGDIEDLVVPAVARIGAATLVELGLTAAARRQGLCAPMLVRPTGSHGGEGLALVARDADAAARALTPGRDHYATAFHGFRSADGFYRKYRMIFVDRRPYPYHLALGRTWRVHYDSSGTVAHPARRDEERRFLDDPEGAIGARAMQAVREVGERLDLDFCGIDFSVLADGRALLFEANATMLVHPEEPDGPLAHKNPHVARILEAFQRRLAVAAAAAARDGA